MSGAWAHACARAGVALAAAALATAVPAAARAHEPSDSLLTLEPGRGAGRWDIAVRDLDDVLGLDADGDGRVTWREARAREADAAAYALGRLVVRTSDGPCAVTAAPAGVVEHSDGGYLALPLAIGCPPSPRALEIDYTLLFDADPQHRGLVRVLDGAGHEQAAALSASDHRRVFPQGGGAGPGFVSFVREGIRHIATGLDHLLFLLALLLPAVLRREDRGWAPVEAMRPALRDVARIVTAFTVAHSLTLSLAALGVARLPARIVEPAIAASVVVAAVNNVRPLFGRDRWVVALALGLLHGFGFSSVLADARLGRGPLVAALLGFNLGVELGQLAAVAAFVPLAYLARRTAAYRRVTLPGGSLAIAALAFAWFVERTLDIPLLPRESP